MGIKVVVNRCYGGFGLSEAALFAYAERKGLTLYPEKDDKFGTVTYWTVPKDQRTKILSSEQWINASLDERKASNEVYESSAIYDRDIKRDDSDLIAVVEELGRDADGVHAKLEVVEIPDGVSWRINEYDGQEWVAEEHRTW